MKRLEAYPVYLLMQAAYGLFFSTIVTVNLVYQVTTVGLNPLQLVLVGTVLETTVLLFEIPTGLVADIYSRRLSVIIGFLLVGAGFMLEGSIPLFSVVLLSQIVWGVGATFLSGATEAWIADEIGHGGGSDRAVGQLFLRGAQLNQAGSLIGIGLSVALASISISLPIVLGGALLVGLALLLALVMPEAGFAPVPTAERSSWRSLQETLRAGLALVRSRPVLLTILAISLIFGMSSEGYDRLWTAHVLENFSLPALGQLEPIVWFGLIRAVGMALTLGAAEIARRTIDTASHRAVARSLMLLDGLLIISLAGFALTTSFGLALAAYWLASSLRTTREPLYAAWLNQHVESRLRATLLSTNGQADALGQIAGGPLVGAVGTIFSLRSALLLAGLILAPALALYGRTLGQAPHHSGKRK